MAKTTFLGIPDALHTKDELVGTLSRLDDVEEIVVLLVSKKDGFVLLSAGENNQLTYEQVNFLLDRGKIRMWEDFFS